MDNSDFRQDGYVLDLKNESPIAQDELKFINFLDLSSIFEPCSIFNDDLQVPNQSECRKIDQFQPLTTQNLQYSEKSCQIYVQSEDEQYNASITKSNRKTLKLKKRPVNRGPTMTRKMLSECEQTSNWDKSEQCGKFEFIFNEQKIKGKYHKNTNVPKMLVRIFLKHFGRTTSGQEQNILRHHEVVKEKLQQRSTNNYKIPDLLMLLDAGCEQEKGMGIKNRQAMREIIHGSMRQEIILNQFVKRNQMSYLIAMKIFAIRCRSRKLVQRVKIM